jgi:hypothetical protein
MLGECNPFYGKKHSLESIDKIRSSKIGVPSMLRGSKGKPPVNKGKSIFEVYDERTANDILRKMSVSKKGRYTGKDNPNWKGGITSLWHLIRNSDYNKSWRSKVYARDNHTCVMCGIKGNGSNLEAHHIKPFSLILQEFVKKYSNLNPIDNTEALLKLSLSYSEFWDISNGKTLCSECHHTKVVHKKYRPINSSRISAI